MNNKLKLFIYALRGRKHEMDEWLEENNETEVRQTIYEYEKYLKNPQPIESAPKDGTLIDIWYRQERIPNVYWNEEHSMWRDDSGDYFDDATHWRPIPTIEE